VSRSIRCTAPGKLVLLGEYVVLEGAPAIVAAMNRRAEVRATSSAGFCVSVPAWQIDAAAFCFVDGEMQFADSQLQAGGRLRYVRALSEQIAVAAGQMGGALRPCHLELDTTAFYLPAPDGGAPQKLGLGSSAALCVALLVAYLEQANLLQTFLPLEAPGCRQALLELAHGLHQRAQNNNGSGVDVAASVHGGLLHFLPARPAGPPGSSGSPGASGPAAGTPLRAHPLRPLPGLCLVAIWSGQSASTPAMLARVAQLKRTAPQAYWAIYEKLATYAQAGTEFWQLQDVAALSQVMDAYYTTLGELGTAAKIDIVTPAHAAIYTLVRQLGGVYKTSGAGGGDVGIALCPSSRVAERLQRRLRRTPYRAISLDVDPVGVALEVL
jgi:phosphomevalonate kinase